MACVRSLTLPGYSSDNKGHYVDSVTNMITLKISCLKGILIDKGHYV